MVTLNLECITRFCERTYIVNLIKHAFNKHGEFPSATNSTTAILYYEWELGSQTSWNNLTSSIAHQIIFIFSN